VYVLHEGFDGGFREFQVFKFLSGVFVDSPSHSGMRKHNKLIGPRDLRSGILFGLRAQLKVSSSGPRTSTYWSSNLGHRSIFMKMMKGMLQWLSISAPVPSKQQLV
jgi:hypothetical protein